MWNKKDDVSYGGALQKFRKMKRYPSPLNQTEFNMLLTVFVSETGSILFIVDVFFILFYYFFCCVLYSTNNKQHTKLFIMIVTIHFSLLSK